MFRSWIKLGGIPPVDFSDLTLLSLTPGSASLSSRVWELCACGATNAQFIQLGPDAG